MNLFEANKKLSTRHAGELVSDKPTEQITWTLYHYNASRSNSINFDSLTDEPIG